MANGKGDKQIPPQVTHKEYRDNHDNIKWPDRSKGKKDGSTKG